MKARLLLNLQEYKTQLCNKNNVCVCIQILCKVEFFYQLKTKKTSNTLNYE